MEETYYIWSTEHNRWWKPGGNGYTENLEEAGDYGRVEAMNICANSALGHKKLRIPNELPIRSSDVDYVAHALLEMIMTEGTSFEKNTNTV